MVSFFVISDALDRGNLDFVTGYWTGTELTEALSDAKRYSTVSEASQKVREGDFYDPAVHEVEETEAGLQKTRFIDMAGKYGKMGGN